MKKEVKKKRSRRGKKQLSTQVDHQREVWTLFKFKPAVQRQTQPSSMCLFRLCPPKVWRTLEITIIKGISSSAERERGTEGGRDK